MMGDGISQLNTCKNTSRITNPDFIHLDFAKTPISTFQNQIFNWKWTLWQIIGYPVEMLIILTVPKEKKMKMINYLMNFPIGQIYLHEQKGKVILKKALEIVIQTIDGHEFTESSLNNSFQLLGGLNKYLAANGSRTTDPAGMSSI